MGETLIMGWLAWMCRATFKAIHNNSQSTNLVGRSSSKSPVRSSGHFFFARHALHVYDIDIAVTPGRLAVGRRAGGALPFFIYIICRAPQKTSRTRWPVPQLTEQSPQALDRQAYELVGGLVGHSCRSR